MSPGPWRTGRKVGRTIYDAGDRLIGVMDHPDDAAIAASAARLHLELAETRVDLGTAISLATSAAERLKDNDMLRQLEEVLVRVSDRRVR